MIVYAILVLFFMFWPLLVGCFLLKNHEKLQRDDYQAKAFKVKYDALINDIRHKSFITLLYPTVFAVRRFNIVMVNILFTQDSPLSGVERTLYMEKILFLLLIQTLYLAYIHLARPHEDKVFNSLELINEYALCACAYTMLTFTGLYNSPIDSSDSEMEKIGTSTALLLVLFIFCINTFFMTKITIGKIVIKIKRCCKVKQANNKKLEKSNKKNKTKISKKHQLDDPNIFEAD